MPRSQTLPDLLDEMAERYGERPFIFFEGETVTYAQFRLRVRELARALIATGIRKDDKVGVWMGNQIEWLLMTFATTMVGATFVAINTWWRSRELEYALALADVKLLVFANGYSQNDYVQAFTQIDRAKLPKLELLVCLELDARIPEALSFPELLALASNVSEKEIDTAKRGVSPDDIAFILFTSGSTAHPKAVQNQHWGLIKNLFQIGERVHLTEDDRVLVSISLFWGFGIANAVFAIMTHGACIVLQHRFDAGEALMLIETQRCTGLYATPNIALALKGHKDRPSRDISSLRTGLGMPAAVSLMIDLGASEACALYGLTECYGNSAVTDAREPAEIRQFTCGRPLPDTEIVIADPTTHEPLPQGAVGEIKLRGFVMPGYYKDPERTAQSTDKEGYFLTGDLGMFDERGYLVFQGRLKEMVKSGGINVSPAEVEEVLRSHIAITQALVVGIPDPTLDEVLAAGIVLENDASLSNEEIVAHCRKEMATYKIPRFFVTLRPDEVPLTETGKPDKKTLQRLFSERFAKAAAG